MAALLVIGLLLGQAASALSGQGMLSIRGTVTDQSGALMPGITIEIRSDPNKPPEKVVTDERGAYVLNGLSQGVYELSANLPAFERNVRGVDLTASANMDFALRVQTVETCACISSSAQPAAPLPLPQDSFRRARGEQAALHLWQNSIQSKDRKNPQEIEAQQ